MAFVDKLVRNPVNRDHRSSGGGRPVSVMVFKRCEVGEDSRLFAGSRNADDGSCDPGSGLRGGIMW